MNVFLLYRGTGVVFGKNRKSRNLVRQRVENRIRKIRHFANFEISRKVEPGAKSVCLMKPKLGPTGPIKKRNFPNRSTLRVVMVRTKF